MDPFLGEIRIVPWFAAGNNPPTNWAFCEGQLMSIASHSALFSLLGTRFGGNGTSNFALPDLRGRVALGFGQGNNLPAYTLGQSGGATTATLQTQNLPPHNHMINVSTGNGTTVNPGGSIPAVTVQGAGKDAQQLPTYAQVAPVAQMANNAVSLTGSSTPFNIEPPYLTLVYLIALVGIYPSSN